MGGAERRKNGKRDGVRREREREKKDLGKRAAIAVRVSNPILLFPKPGEGQNVMVPAHSLSLCLSGSLTSLLFLGCEAGSSTPLLSAVSRSSCRTRSTLFCFAPFDYI